ncbi:prolyl oligopeptidase family serine peptidase [Flammeovirga sp. SubArs3]|uniref:prolyl oligopeptidase family serine peptidase n=1 Tax=Flammeovirga sp. SubArs3 TaxID=2995316 RepID=UPI00248B443D|nr:prolyl oligopeptidase family serine peptidase [Flammeovirga sp. SubArs3]
MNKLITYLTSLAVLFLVGCNDNTPEVQNNGEGTIRSASTFSVVTQEDITYAEGLGRNPSNSSLVTVPLKLDIYFPDNNYTDRPVFMFIHGGGFKGGTKTKPEIVEMAEYYASRGWVFASIDYRTTEELGSLQGLSQDDLFTYYKGIAPQEWIENTFEGAETQEQVQQSIAMYTAQRDSKAALRWLIANANNYNIDKDLITVGGASAGAITTIALGISNPEDFRNEISLDDDPTLSSTNLDQTYDIKSMIYFWGSNIKLDVFEGVYQLNRYDANDPELFMAHGDQPDPVTPYEEALELQGIYDSLGIYNQLYTLEGFGHGAWNATVNGKGLFELSFDFLVDRQNLITE